MTAFEPVNALEVHLRRLLTREDGRVWQFLTPLAAARLWLITRHYPELDGTDLAAPVGRNPDYCIFRSPQGAAVSVYTSEERVRTAFEFFKLSPADFTWVHAPGYALLQWLWADHSETDDVEFHVNFAVENAAWHLDPDLIKILLDRPDPSRLAARTMLQPEPRARQM